MTQELKPLGLAHDWSGLGDAHPAPVLRIPNVGGDGDRSITSRPQFIAALSHLNELAKSVDIPTSEATAAFIKVAALRAWAAHDRRVTAEDRKEANRCQTRIFAMLSSVAEREQPARWLVQVEGKRGGSTPGPVAWLMKELKISHAIASHIRAAGTRQEAYREAIDSGRAWFSFISNSTPGSTTPLARITSWMHVNNSARYALAVPRSKLRAVLLRLRKLKAWCEAAEATLVQRIAREGKAEK